MPTRVLMRQWCLLAVGCGLLLSPLRANATGGIDLSIGCPLAPGTTNSATVDCAFATQLVMSGTLISPVAMSDLASIEGFLTITLQSGTIAQAPFWDFQTTNPQGLTGSQARPPGGCLSYLNTFSPGGSSFGLVATAAGSAVHVATLSVRAGVVSVVAGQKLYAFRLILDPTQAAEGGGFLAGCTLPVSVTLDSLRMNPSSGSPVTVTDCGLIGNVVLLNGASGGSTCSGSSSTIVASAGVGGGISPSGSILVTTGTSLTLAIGSAACYHIADVLVDGASVGALSSYTFTNVVANHTIAASFALDSYTITASASAGGTISPSGAVAVSCSGSQAFTLTPTGGNIVVDVLVDGASVGAVSSYTFTNVTANHTISGQFAPPPVLTVNITGSGSVAKSPDQASYTPGTIVQLTATASAGYHFEGWSGAAIGRTNPVTVTMTADKTVSAVFLANSYTWNQLGSASWQVSTNWTPTRWTPSTDDVLSFGNGATVVTNVPTQSIGQLFLTGSADVTLQPNVAGDSVAVLGGSGVDFDVQAGAVLRFNTANAIRLDLLAGVSGTVSGGLFVDAGAHRLRSLAAGGLVFQPAARVTQGTTFSGNLFGTGSGTNGVLNSVLFEFNSLFDQYGGANPFGAIQPNAVAVFRLGSRYRINGPGFPSMSGRTYADFEYNSPFTTISSGTGRLRIDNLSVLRGNWNIGMTGQFEIRGDITVTAGAALNFNPITGAPTVALNGAWPQTITVNGALTDTASVTIEVRNAAGVTLATDVTLPGGLKFTTGKITTGANVLSIVGPSFSVTGAGSGTGWVVGTLGRTLTPSAGEASCTFDVGDATSYTPVTVAAHGVGGAFILRGSTTRFDHPHLASSDIPLLRSVNRYYTLTPAGSPAFTSYDATFNYAAADIDAGSDPNAFIVRRWDGSVWNTTAIGARTATSTQTTGMTTFSDFAIGQLGAYTITASAGLGGSISPSGLVTVLPGAGKTFSITPVAPARIKDVVVDGLSVGAVSTYAFTSVSANHTISATFEVVYDEPFTSGLDMSKWAYGSNQPLYVPAEPSGAVAVSKPFGGSFTFQYGGFGFLGTLSGDFDVSVDYSDMNIARSSGAPGNQVQLNTTFGGQAFSAVRSNEDGMGENGHVFINPPNTAPGVTSMSGTSGTLRVRRIGGTVTGYVNGAAVYSGTFNTGPVTTLSLTMQNNGTLDATSVTFDNFHLVADGISYGPAEQARIVASAGAHGSIAPSGLAYPTLGTSPTYAITPEVAYKVADVTVDGSSVGALAAYTFTNLQTNHTIVATFISDIPVVTFTSGPAEGEIVGPGTVSFGWSATSASTLPAGMLYRYSMDGVPTGSFATASSQSFSSLAEGSHVLTVEAKDVNGNIGTANRGFVIDITPPTVSITNGPAEGGFVNATTVPFAWSGADNLSAPAALKFSYRLDGAAFNAYAAVTSATLNGLAEGAHTFEVRVADQAANVGLSPATRLFSVDVTAPETQIVSGPAEGATITTASPVFVLTGTDNLSSPGQLLYQFSVDNGTYSTPAATPLTVPGLAEGTHSVAIRAVDLAGNVDATPAMRSFVAHVEPPNKIIVDGPPAWTPLTSVTYTFSSVTNQPPESIEYAWRLDGGALTSYTNATTATFSGLSESLHSFELHARDGFGLEHSVTNTFTVDHTAPSTSISGGTPAGGWASDVQPASFILTGTDNLAPVGLLRYAYRLDGDPFTVPALGTSVSFPGLPEGSHTFEVYAVDAAGTVDASPAARTFTVDLHTPETSIASGPVAGSTVTTAAVPFQWAGSDDQTPTGQLRFAYRADSGAYTAPGAGSISIPLADGGHTVDVAAVDLAGNADPTPASRTFTVDAHPPVISFDTAPAPGACITTADAVFVWSATDAVSVPAQITYATRVDGGPLSAFSAATSTTVNLSSEGTHTFEVQAKDAAGNVGALSRSWRFDVTVPTAYAPAMRLQDGNSMSIVCTSADNVEVVSYHIQIATSLVFTSPVYEGNVDAVGKTSFTGSAGNSYYCRAQAIDCAGNVSAYSAPSNGISIANLPDLVVTSVVVPPIAPSGQLMEVAWTVRNSGLGATNAPTWSDGVYLSPTPSYNPVTAVPLGSAQNLTFLAPTEAYVRHASYTLPRGAAGTYYILVAADQYNGLPESNGDNNLTASTAFTILPTAAADLVASDVSSPQAAVSGDAVTITWRVTNHGVGRSDASVWYDTVLLSDDDQLSYSLDGGGAIRVFDTPLAVIAHSGALEPDSGYLASAVVGLPASAAGSYHIIVVADLNAPNAGQFVSQVGNVFENNAELNVAVALDLLDITPQPPANLIAESATAPLSAVSGGGALVSWTVRNGGVHATRTTSWTDRVYLSTDANFNPGSDPLYAAVTHNGVLEIGGEYTAQANLYMPIWLSGSFYVFVLVDADNRVGEESEADNGVGAPSPLAVTLSDWPDLRVTSGQVPATTRAGNSIPVSWTVENDGAGPTPGGWRDNVYISPSPTWNGSARFVGAFGNAAGLASSDHYTQGQLINIPTNVSGVQYVYVITDADGNIFENADEGNNLTMIGSVDVAAYPPVDLRITGVTLTDTTASGRGMGVGWSGSNIGTGTTLAGAWTELVYLSTDQVLDGGDYFLGSTVHGGSLPPGAGYSNGLGAGLPNTFSGTFYAIVLSDPGASTGDIDMSNNVAVSTTTVTVRLQPAPDLLVSALVVPTDALSGQGFTAQWTVTNSGEGVTIPSGWTADFYLSTDPYLDGGDTPLGGIRHEGALEAGAVVNESAGLGIPGYASGPYFVIVRVDGRNEVYEAGRDNNVAVSGRIDATLAAPADLVVRDVAISPLSVPGDPVTITWTLVNESDNPAVGSIENAFYVSRDSAYQETDPLVSIQSQFINLAPHASQVIKGTVSVERTLKLDTQGNVTATLPGVAPGLYYAIVRTNTRNTVRELALDNNLALSASPTQVDVEELVLGVPRSAIGVTGSSRYYRLATSADADVQLTLSSDQPDATNELYLAFDRVPRPGDFDFTGPAEFTAHPSLVVPGTQAGDYYVLALSRAVPGTPQTLTVEAHVLPFSISSITPNYGGQAGTVTCDLRGAALRDTTHVYLRQGDTFVAEAQVAFVNTTHLQVKWGLANVQEDLYDVVAVNGDSVATLVSGFRVQRPTELAVTITPDQPDVVRGNGTGYYTFRFRNESNQDMPHLRARLAFPAGSQLIALSGDARLKRRSDLHPALFEPVTGDADVVMDPAIGESLRVADLEAVGLSPGQELSCTVGFKNFLRNPYSVRAYAEGLEPDAYIDRALARIEVARQRVLAHPEQASSPAVVLASDALTFAETAFAGAYVATGLVSAGERDAYRTAHGGLVTTGATGPQAPVSLLNELALGHACSIPGGSPECRPNAAPTGSAIPACVATLVDTLPGDVYLPERLPLGLATSLAVGYSVTVSADTRVVTPCDPNLITGPVGYGPEQYVGQGQAMSYRVDFSNDYDNAEAPAQVVKIVVPLDSDLDASSFRLGSLGFGGGVYTFTPPSDHLTDYTVESNIASLGVIVRMTAVIDVAAQQLKWTFESLDPVTRQPPASASVGFLPVNNGTHRGEGFATYTVRPRTVAATGTIVTAQAQITFDRNAPLLTNTATNRVDNALPASTIAQDVLLQPGNLAALHWHGSDTGTGVKSYAVYASKDASPFVLQASDIADTALTLPVESGHRYQFYTRATDNTNNVEPAKATGEAATIVPVVGVTQPGVDLPVRFALYPSFPNPFRRATTVRFDLPVDAPTRLEIFDLQGRRVAMPLEGKVMKAGRHTIQVGSAGMRAGVYFYRLTAAQFVMTRKMTLVR